LELGTWQGDHCLFWPTFMIFALQQHHHIVLVFSFIGRWYSYSKSYIICGCCFFIIVTKFFGIKVFNAISKVCNLVSTRVGPLYIISSWFSYIHVLACHILWLPSFMVWMWSYHWQFKYPFTSMPLQEWTYNNPYISKYNSNYCFGKWNTCSEGGVPPFSLLHPMMSGYSYHQRWLLNLVGCHHC
jgi:hypothetical protein